MDYLTRARVMAAFCRQRAQMENEDENFWLQEAEIWQKRAETKVINISSEDKIRQRRKLHKGRQSARARNID
jgi:hypothetical protein